MLRFVQEGSVLFFEADCDLGCSSSEFQGRVLQLKLRCVKFCQKTPILVGVDLIRAKAVNEPLNALASTIAKFWLNSRHIQVITAQKYSTKLLYWNANCLL